MNFGPRGAFPGPIQAASSPAGRFRNMHPQQNMPPTARGSHHQKERPVTFMPNDQIKIPKAPKQPDKPLPAYMRYSRKVWEKVKAANPEMKMWDIGKLIGEQWRNLPEDERQGFFAEYEVEKSEYQEAMKAYHNSTAYREWLKSKEKAQQAIQDQQMMEKMIGQQIPKEEPRFQLQQVEDEDEDAEFAIKHIAAARYQRNHRLITEIFSEAVVPDAKSIVTRPRLENLKRQVQSLMQHQRKLESEIEEMEDKFGTKRKKIMDNSQNFKLKIEELSKLPPPPPTPEPMETEKKNAEEEEKSKGNEEEIENDQAETNDDKKEGEKQEKTEEKEMVVEEGKNEEVDKSATVPATSPSKEKTATLSNESDAATNERDKSEPCDVKESKDESKADEELVTTTTTTPKDENSKAKEEEGDEKKKEENAIEQSKTDNSGNEKTPVTKEEEKMDESNDNAASVPTSS